MTKGKTATNTFTAERDDAGTRLDQFLVARIGDVSRSRVQMLIDQQKVEVDGRQVKASHRLEGGEEVRVLGSVQPPPLKARAEEIPLDVVFEDDAIAVVNKPAGMMVHAGAASSAEEDEEGDPRTRGTLVNALLYRFNKLSKVGGELRPGIVHRLDKDTSGLMVVAKNDSAHRKLAEQFAARQVKKTYLALVHGWPKEEQGTVAQPIGRDPVKRHRMKVGGVLGREAVSHYKQVRQLRTAYGRFALLEVAIETGRTHQIRVHLASLGHPVVGDTLYGAPTAIQPVDTGRNRARKADTKASRDREQSELARQLTEAAWGEKPVAAKRVSKGKKSARAKSSKESAKTSTEKTVSNSEVDSGPLLPLTLDRNFLHAAALELTHPKSGQRMRFEAPLPEGLDTFLARLTAQGA